MVALFGAIVFAAVAGPLLATLTDSELGFGLAPLFLAVTLVAAPYMGVARAALVVAGGASWITPSQLALASATLGAAAVGNLGVTWAAAAIAVATVLGAAVLATGLRRHDALPGLGDLADLGALRSDLQALQRR